jgi:protein NrfD
MSVTFTSELDTTSPATAPGEVESSERIERRRGDFRAQAVKVTEDVTYYDYPALKPSPFGDSVAFYIFLAGLSGAAQIVATLADLCGRAEAKPIVRSGRYLAMVATIAGPPLLIYDLHTPQRFYNMLRIFRKTSPMSIGTYVLSTFSAFSTATALAQLIADRRHSRLAERIARVTQLPAAVAGAGMTSYPAALLAATSTPLWAAAPRLLGIQFASSSVATGAAAISLATGNALPPGTRVAVEALAATASTVTLAASRLAERTYYEAGVETPLYEGPLRVAQRIGVQFAGSAFPAVLYAENYRPSRPRPSRRLSIAASLAILAGGLLLRSVIIRAGNKSARRAEDYFRFARTDRRREIEAAR